MQSRRIITALIIMLFIHAGRAAAQNYPRWWLGAFGGISFSGFQGAIHALDAAHPDVASPDGFTGGSGTAPLGGVMFEYEAEEYLGGALAVVYDDRSIESNHTNLDANPSREHAVSLATHMAYISIEPDFRLGLGGGFSLLAGPSIAFNISKGYDYAYLPAITTPPSTGVIPTSHTSGELSEARPIIFGGQLTFQADIPITRVDSVSRIVISPFLGFKVKTDLLQSSTASTYTANTFRFGIAVKLGVSRKRS